MLRGLEYATLRTDRKTVNAVERNLEITGEATASLPDAIVDPGPEAPWHYMKSLRKLLIHEYFGVDVGILWQTLRKTYPRSKLARSDNLIERDTACIRRDEAN